MIRQWRSWGAVAALLAVGAASPPAYWVVDRIAGPDGRYDYASVDSGLRRLFVGRGGGVMTVDLDTRRVTPVFAKGEGVAAVLLVPGTPLMLGTNGDAGTAMLLDRRTGRRLATIPTGKDPDGVAFDRRSGLAFVMNGDSEDVTVIDVRRRRAVATVPVDGKPEGAVADGLGSLFVNIEDTAVIARIDIASRKVVSRYRLQGCEEPTGIAHDPIAKVLISVCHNGVAKLVDARTGADRGGFVIGRMADGAIFNPARRLVFVPCNDGTLTVVALDRRGAPTPVATVATQEGARTAALDVASGRLYLPATDYVRDREGEPQRVPGTFKVLVVAPTGEQAQ